jgi:hypothetical protein
MSSVIKPGRTGVPSKSSIVTTYSMRNGPNWAVERHSAPFSESTVMARPAEMAVPPVGDWRDRRPCDIPWRAILAASKPWSAVPIIGDSEPRAFTNRANAQAECLAAPSLKGTGRIKSSRY